MRLNGFLYALRAQQIPVGTQEWLVLLEALTKDLHRSTLTGFYHLARSLLIHSEAHFDAFDQAFNRYFQGMDINQIPWAQDILDWLNNPKAADALDAQAKAALEALDLETLRRELEKRLAEQKERHDGGSHWVGTGGTSPFGHSGYHPTGVRIGGPPRGGNAAQVAAERRYRGYRRDRILDIRQIQVALRKLRDLRREGRRDELDLNGSIERTSKNGGDLELVWQAKRRNDVKLILMMDVGGSMDPHAHTLSRLFSAAYQSKHFRDFHAFYFHNCIYEHVYLDAQFAQEIALVEILRTYGPTYKLIVLGDARMHPLELLSPGGAIDYWHRNEESGRDWLDRIRRHFHRAIWLNPDLSNSWNHITVREISTLFPMFPLTLDGLDNGIQTLVGARVDHATIG